MAVQAAKDELTEKENDKKQIQKQVQKVSMANLDNARLEKVAALLIKVLKTIEHHHQNNVSALPLSGIQTPKDLGVTFDVTANWIETRGVHQSVGITHTLYFLGYRYSMAHLASFGDNKFQYLLTNRSTKDECHTHLYKIFGIEKEPPLPRKRDRCDDGNEEPASVKKLKQLEAYADLHDKATPEELYHGKVNTLGRDEFAKYLFNRWQLGVLGTADDLDLGLESSLVNNADQK